MSAEVVIFPEAERDLADAHDWYEQRQEGLICILKTDEPLSLGRTINTSFVIPYIQLKGSNKVSLFIRSSGWIENDVIINIYLGKQKKMIDTRNIFN